MDALLSLSFYGIFRFFAWLFKPRNQTGQPESNQIDDNFFSGLVIGNEIQQQSAPEATSYFSNKLTDHHIPN